MGQKDIRSSIAGQVFYYLLMSSEDEAMRSCIAEEQVFGCSKARVTDERVAARQIHTIVLRKLVFCKSRIFMRVIVKAVVLVEESGMEMFQVQTLMEELRSTDR